MARIRLTLDMIAEMDAASAQQWWTKLYGTPPPSIATQLLRLGIAYKLQLKSSGVREAKMRLPRSNGVAALPSRKLAPGTRLVRDWHGVGHTVTVLESGFEYDGKHWTSLTAIARAITGAKWSGPRFFGLL